MSYNIGPALAMPSALPSPNVSTSSIREKCTTQALKNALDDGKDTGEFIVSAIIIFC